MTKKIIKINLFNFWYKVSVRRDYDSWEDEEG